MTLETIVIVSVSCISLTFIHIQVCLSYFIHWLIWFWIPSCFFFIFLFNLYAIYLFIYFYFFLLNLNFFFFLLFLLILFFLDLFSLSSLFLSLSLCLSLFLIFLFTTFTSLYYVSPFLSLFLFPLFLFAALSLYHTLNDSTTAPPPHSFTHKKKTELHRKRTCCREILGLGAKSSIVMTWPWE